MGLKVTQFYERRGILGIFTTTSVLPNHVTHSLKISDFLCSIKKVFFLCVLAARENHLSKPLLLPFLLRALSCCKNVFLLGKENKDV